MKTDTSSLCKIGKTDLADRLEHGNFTHHAKCVCVCVSVCVCVCDSDREKRDIVGRLVPYFLLAGLQ